MAATRPWSALPLWTRLQSEKLAPHVQSLSPIADHNFNDYWAYPSTSCTLDEQPNEESTTFPSPTTSTDSVLSLLGLPDLPAVSEVIHTDLNPLKQVQDKVVPDFEHATGKFTQSNPGARDDNSHGLQLRGEITAAKEPSQPTSSSAISNPLVEFGIPLHNFSPALPKAWRCGLPGCKSRVVFTRGCDLQKHYKRHSQRFYCRKAGCLRSEEKNAATSLAGSSSVQVVADSGKTENNGRRWFASKRDRDRHEAKHSPRIQCTWRGKVGQHCSRVFSRQDNMKDHIRRVHTESELKNNRCEEA